MGGDSSLRVNVDAAENPRKHLIGQPVLTSQPDPKTSLAEINKRELTK